MSELTAEEIRILRAVVDGRMGVNEHGRYIIDGEKRPERKTRESLARKEFLIWPHFQTRKSRISEKGRAALYRAEATDVR